MEAARSANAKKNIYVSLLCQLVTIACGLVLPRLLLKAYGSEAYGAVGSIAQFLSYIAIVEGGIGGVARAALYKPLAERDPEAVGGIVRETERFFRIVALVFVVYALVIACSFHRLSHLECFDRAETFALVLIIAASTFAQYFFGISYCVLLTAAQKLYLVNYVTVLGTVLNTVLSVLLVKAGCSLHVVKLVSALVFIARPVLLSCYAKKKFQLRGKAFRKTGLLTQKWTGLGQHLAYFFHTNTDVVVLTLFANLKLVAVYTVYQMVVSQIRALIASFTGGMEAVFGDMLARQETEALEQAFSRYDTLTSVVSTVLLGCTAALLVPFVRIYTRGIQDENYIRAAFGLLLVIASYLESLRIPYHNLVIAAGHFRETRFAAYGEAALNVGLSLVLVRPLGLIGVALGTAAATLFRMLYYAVYLTQHITCFPLGRFLRRQAVNLASFAAVILLSGRLTAFFAPADYARWIVCAFAVTAVSAVIVLLVNLLVYRDDMSYLFRRIIRR